MTDVVQVHYERTFVGGRGLAAAQIRVVLIDAQSSKGSPLPGMLGTAQDRYVTLRATTVEQALSLIPPAGTPTCVLVDLSSSGAAGLEGLEGLRRFAPHAPVIVLTDDDDDVLGLSALAAGAQDHLVLSRVTPEVLTRSISYALQHKSSEEALFDVSERFRLAFDNSPLGIALISATPGDGASVTEANPALAAILGRGLDTVIGAGALDLVDPRDAGQFALELRALAAGGRSRSHARRRLVGGRGEVVLCSITTSLLRDPFGGPASIVAMFEDVTAEDRREQELGRALDALGKAAYGIALLDISGRYVSANRAHAEALGYEERALVGVPWQTTVDPSDAEPVRRAIARASGGGDGRVEARGRCQDESTFDAELHFVACSDAEGRLTGLHLFLRDITERKVAERALQRSEEQYKRIVETAGEGVWIADQQGVTTFVNDAMCAMLGMGEADLLGREVQDLIVTDGVLRPTPARRASEPASQQRDVRLRHADGHLIWCLMATRDLDDADGPTGTLAMVTDITDRTTAEIELAHRALHDGLTGLPNRALLLDRLRHALEHAARGSCMVGVFFIDLDGFKTINDSLGHKAGDQLLQVVAPRLQAALRGSDTLARFGGDEFVVLCPELTEERDALLVAQRLSDALTEPIEICSGPVSVTASVGIALARGGEAPAEDLIRDADTAMYRAKERGGAACEVFDHAMRAELITQMETEQELRRALAEGQFTLAYQPILNLADQSVVGCEALIRWQHPQRGSVSPGDFIPIAERSGLIVEIGDWVVLAACRQLAEWAAEASSLDGTVLWVNVSAKQFADAGFPRRVAAVLATLGVPASRLCFEVTETALVDLRSPIVPQVMAELTNMGVQLMLDDFGTGYSSLSYIRQMPIAGLKLDRSFVSQMGSDDSVLPIVEAVVGMANSLGLTLVAEGVETQTQLDAVTHFGCERAQGFFFARPMAAADLAQWNDARAARAPVADRRRDNGLTVSLGEAATHLGVGPSTVRRWADSGRLASVRTKGGHRRIVAADVRREARRLAPGVKLNAAAAPAYALPVLADLIEGRGLAVLDVIAQRVYATGTSGWFGASASAPARAGWAQALVAGCRAGNYGPALHASADFFRAASMVGVLPLERHLFLERLRAGFERLLRQAGASTEELIGAHDLLLAIEHQAVGQP